jgi:hypothetical protein
MLCLPSHWFPYPCFPAFWAVELRCLWLQHPTSDHPSKLDGAWVYIVWIIELAHLSLLLWLPACCMLRNDALAITRRNDEHLHVLLLQLESCYPI